MKQNFLAIFITSFLIFSSMGCAQLRVFYDKCDQSKLERLPDNTFQGTIKCINVWDVDKIKKTVSKASITFDFTDTTNIYAIVRSSDSVDVTRQIIRILKTKK